MPNKQDSSHKQFSSLTLGEETKWESIIARYLSDVDKLNKESARSHRFSMFLQELFNDEPHLLENFSSGIEQSLKVKQGGQILRGQADNLFGNLIIEWKTNILTRLSEAEKQLRTYTAIQWSQESPESRTPFICIATDGVRFKAYSPISVNPSSVDVRIEEVSLQELEEVNWTKLTPSEVYFWLDRYLFRKTFLKPTSESIVRDFGESSHAFNTTTQSLLALWREKKERNTYAVVYESWNRYLRIVYGTDIAGDELFIRHTYLATLAKLVAWMRITESRSLPKDKEIVGILEGSLFKKQGIDNFIEEDFFSWLARTEVVKTAINIMRHLFSLLQNYKLHELSEDVLKSLYQQLVETETRHYLGEYYTPDWLAQRVVNRVLDENVEGSLLDPACGSGTFLYLAVKEKRERFGNSLETLQHILNSVCGADVHPLAVITAKTNYILALGDLLLRRKEKITIPVYLADTIRLPQRFMEGTHYEVRLDSQMVLMGAALFTNHQLYDRAIELANEFAQSNKGKRITLELFNTYVRAQRFSGLQDDDGSFIKSLYEIVEALKGFIEKERDSIWAFVLKNIYRPLFFKNRFDYLIGNPPWITFNVLELDYQRFLKPQITSTYRLFTKRAENIPNMEIATYFLVRTADLYLKNGGKVAFVLPRSIFSADQHDELRRRTFTLAVNPLYRLNWKELWDCEKVTPLFNVPTCVLFAEKIKTTPVGYPIKGRILRGKLGSKNASFLEAKEAITTDEVQITLHTRGKRSYWGLGESSSTSVESYYLKQFERGVNTILPHSFWFVDVKPSPVGFNSESPFLQTSARALKHSKKPYRDIKLEGNVEGCFLYTTLLATDLLPFGHLDFSLVILPIESRSDRFKIIDSDMARRRGFIYLAEWLEQVESAWKERRGDKASKMNPYQYLDLFSGLTRQNPKCRYRVVYNKSGTFLTAAAIENKAEEITIGEQTIIANGFISDQTLYYYNTNDSREAFYLTAILNSPYVDEQIKPMQSRGLFGPRDIHKKPLELPIPRYKEKDSTHQRLVMLGEESHEIVSRWLSTATRQTSIGRLRTEVRGVLREQLDEINGIVERIAK